MPPWPCSSSPPTTTRTSRHWAQTFYGPGYRLPVSNINVDGGPLAPNTSQCPVGDTCFYGYGGDDEVEADIEQELAVAPDTSNLLVYNAPNDETGQTELDEYATIANQDHRRLGQLELG